MVLEVDHLSMMLRNLGVIDGEHVAVFMSNTPEMVFTVYALTRLGAVPALINAALRGMFDQIRWGVLRVPGHTILSHGLIKTPQTMPCYIASGFQKHALC